MVNGLVTFLGILIISTQVHATWGLPNTPMTGIGDAGSFYLNKSGFTLHVFNNDYLGNTDKLMTASGHLFWYIQPKNKKHGWELSVQRRLLTPIIKTKHGKPPLDPPPGVYADQLESRGAYSYIDGNMKIELGLSGQYYAGLGGDKITKFIHKVIGAKDESSKYGDKIDNNYFSGSVGVGFLTKYALVMLYVHESPVMTETLVRLNLKFSGKKAQFGIQGEAVHQLKSDFYGNDILDFRHAYGLSYKYGWYQMTANYVSPYLKYDKYGQYYISPLILSWEF